jgi:hypothetical protein
MFTGKQNTGVPVTTMERAQELRFVELSLVNLEMISPVSHRQCHLNAMLFS